MRKRARHRIGSKMNEQRFEDLYGSDLLATIEKTDFGCPVPIMGTPFWVYQDVLMVPMAGGGFDSVSSIVERVTVQNKKQQIQVFKVGTAGVVASSNSLWNVGTFPPAGGVAAAAPGGAVPTKATTGAQPFNNGTPDSLHMLGTPDMRATVNNMALLAYDRIFHGTMSLNASNVAWTGVPNRYTGAAAAGNFFSLEVTTVMSATATNLTLTYVDDAGNAAEAAAAVALTVSSAVNRIPLPTPRHDVALNGSDLGLRNVTNVASSGANTGVANIFIGHPLAIFPCLTANMPNPLDLVNGYTSLPKVEDNACIAWIELGKTATSATTYQGTVEMAS